MDTLSYILLLTALFIRHLDQETETHTYARNMFALSLLFLYLRFLGVFLIWKRTGIPIIMIIKMVIICVFTPLSFYKIELMITTYRLTL